MIRAVLKSIFFMAVFFALATGCSGGGNPDVLDAAGDIAGDVLSPDAADAIHPADVHDTTADNGTDAVTRDTSDASDTQALDTTDIDDPDVQPADTIDAADGIVPDNGEDVPDSGEDADSVIYECLTDDDCAGKVSVTVCQTPYCNEDNICEAINLDDDTECSDNSICTTGDKCVGGQCVGVTVNCDDGQECTQDLCSEANYCYTRPYYGPCNDSNECTDNDSCGTGVCRGTEISCNDNNPCTSENCDINSGCIVTKLSGPKCTDADQCTKNDVCVSGVCTGTFDCDDSNPCTADGCNELGCTHDPLTGDICNDGLICTENDSCQAGVCTGADAVCDDGDPCTDDYCQEGVGCKTRFNTATCDDTNACTRNDRCQYGQCKGTSYSCPILTCMDANNCDGLGGCVPDFSDFGTPCTSDGKQCTNDICSEGACIHPNSDPGSSCNDGDLCTQTDECSNGVCVGRNPITCSVVDACKDPGTCDPATGTCTLGVLPENALCNDSDLCTKNDRCTSGACKGTPVTCVAINDCHRVGVCDETNGTCSEVLKDDGESCNDRNPCTQTDQCLDGTCIGGNPVVCTALDDCHVPGFCNIGTGLCSNPVAPNNTECDDEVGCTKNDKCTSGFCNGEAYSCNDNLSCTSESCDGLGGCVYDVINNWCRINNTCVMPTSVMPGNMCMVCDPARDQEGYSPVTGGFCDDFDYCTYDDTCTNGTCAGTPHPCDDGKPCTTDTCNGFGGCDYSVTPGWCLIEDECYENNQQDPDFPCKVCNTLLSQTQFMPRENGEPCDDGVACTHTDKCSSNVCTGIAYSCSDSIDCTTDSCKGDGTCLFMAIPGYCYIDGACIPADTVQPGNACAACQPNISSQFWSGYREGETCDDGSLCTAGDICSSGVCAGLPKCDDAMDCTDDFCEATTGDCTNTVHENYCTINGGCYLYGQQDGLNECVRCMPLENNRGWTETDGYGCDDSDGCTVDDTCDGAICTGTPKSCDDGLECTSDFCQYGLCGTIPVEGWCVIDNQCVTSGTSPMGDPCSICDPSMNPYDWSYTHMNSCDDLDSCSRGDICIAGMCLGQAYDCSDGVFCTSDICDGNGGCAYGVVAGMCLIDGGCYEEGEISLGNICEHCVSGSDQYGWTSFDGAPCDDMNDCTSDDVCGDSACAGSPYDCDDGLVCTDDFCNGDGTCRNELTGGWCKIDGVCYRDQTLEPGNICSACLSSTSNDSWSANNGLPCDDGIACTKTDTCTNSECVGTTYACDDGKICTDDTCDGFGGCDSTLIPGNCMINFTCYANSQFNPDNICEKCISGTSTSRWSPADGFACNDFDPCTVNTICSAGACGGGSTYSCDDGIECTIDSCDGSGGCGAHPLASNACMIDGICYTAGDEKPGVPCEACDPSSDQFAWTDLSLGAIEICNGVDDGCDGTTDPEGASGCVNYYVDADLDGVGVSSQFKCLCESNEVYRATVGGDCDDTEPQVYTGRVEGCDGLDNDCDGLTDPDNTVGCQLFFRDNDSDTWGVDSDSRCLCSQVGKYTSVTAGDCNDASGEVNPSVDEVCNEIDDNCDGRTDPQDSPGCLIYHLDTDGDTWGDPMVTRCLCAPTTEFKIMRADDCDDFDATVNPDRTETCNDVDDDCSGMRDDAPLLTLCPHDPGDIQNGAIVCELTCRLNCAGANHDLGVPGWYNLDGVVTNGCECQGDLLELSSTASQTNPFQAPPVADTGMVEVVSGNLAMAPYEDWLLVTAFDTMWESDPDTCDNFNLTVQFTSNPGSEFVMDMFRQHSAGGGEALEPLCQDLAKWDFATNFDDGELGECPCDTHVCATWPEDSAELAECKAVHGNQWQLYCGLCGEHDPAMNVCTNNSQTIVVKIHRRDGAPITCSGYELEISNGYYEFVAP